MTLLKVKEEIVFSFTSINARVFIVFRTFGPIKVHSHHSFPSYSTIPKLPPDLPSKMKERRRNTYNRDAKGRFIKKTQIVYIPSANDIDHDADIAPAAASELETAPNDELGYNTDPSADAVFELVSTNKSVLRFV